MGDLKDFAKKQGKFLVIDPGETLEVVYTGQYTFVDDPTYGEGVNFKVRLSTGEEKKWSTRNSKIIAKFDDYRAGDRIAISRTEKDANGKSKWDAERVAVDTPF